MTFGKDFRREHFVFPKDVTPLNNGSYGAIPKRVRAKALEEWQNDIEFPDRFMYKQQKAKMVENLEVVARVLQSDYRSLAFVQNGTTGMNTVIQGFQFNKGDTILTTSLIFLSTGNIVSYTAKRLGLNVAVVDINFPITETEVLARFEAALQKHHPKAAIFDTISSMPGIRMPFEKMTALCRQYDVASMIDGAHSVGMLPINLDRLQPDFFVTNLHKWAFCPRGSAVLYVDTKWHDVIMPLPVSRVYADAPFYQRFLTLGSSNFTSFYCTREAVDFIKEDCGGFEQIREYCNFYARKLEKHFGPDRILKIDGLENDGNFMVNVKADVDKESAAILRRAFSNPATATEVNQYIRNGLLDGHNTYFPIGYYDGALFARFSVEVFNEYDEFIWGYNQFDKLLRGFLKEKREESKN